MNLSWVTPHLAVGGSFGMEEAAELARGQGIERVVDLRSECCDDEEVLRSHGLLLLKLPTDDGCAVSQERLDEGVAWVDAQLAAGRRVFVHCEHGIGRSALLGLCVLVSLGHDPLEALALLKRARRQASPGPEQLEAFRAWVSRRAPRFPVPPLDALGRIAWAA
ncbi:MAG TPA: dual specificity protein phosphatase family protein [Myxococcales bacterium]|jgi:protein-tyrosine phosphatase|nr:dual specificity protein phosphatase family protein [Myxococcales bacterium]